MKRVLAFAAFVYVLLAAGPASAQSPICLPAPAPPIPLCSGSPGPEPTPSPTSSAPAPTSFSPSPTMTSAPPATVSPGPVLPPPVPQPTPAPPSGPPPSVAPTPAPTSPAPVVATSPVSFAGSFGLGVVGLLLVSILLPYLASLGRRSPGGTMLSTRRTRLSLGLACIAVAALIGFVGWYKVSGEPLPNRQIPLLASAGMALVLLSAVGGSLLVAEQLRTDDRRLDELEEAVRTLALALAPMVESPARGGTPTGE